jgi:hypothetical protein
MASAVGALFFAGWKMRNVTASRTGDHSRLGRDNDGSQKVGYRQPCRVRRAS